MKKSNTGFQEMADIAQYSRQKEEKAHDKGCLGKNVSWLNFIFKIFLSQYVEHYEGHVQSPHINCNPSLQQKFFLGLELNTSMS